MFKCFCEKIISFCDSNLVIPLSVGNTRNSFFSSEQDTLCQYWIKKNDSNREFNIVPVKFLFKWSPRYLTRLPCSLVRYRGDNEKGNSIFTSNHELFCLLDKHYSPLLTRKVDYTKKWEFDIPSSTWQSGAEGEWRSAADWRYKSMQLIRQMFFYHLSMKKALRFPQYFIFRFCRDNSIK